VSLLVISFCLNDANYVVIEGPLLWHWENNQSGDPSIELDLEEVKALARNIGFEIKVRVTSRSVRLLYNRIYVSRRSG
jgi:hypothetical protein